MQAAGAADRVFSLLEDYTPLRPDATTGLPGTENTDSGALAAAAAVASGDSGDGGGLIPLHTTLSAGGLAGPALEFKDVHFAYPTRLDAPVLQGLSLSVARGEMVAVVGASGGGKSTLLSLLTALYTPTSGEVYFGGHPVFASAQQVRATF